MKMAYIGNQGHGKSLGAVAKTLILAELTNARIVSNIVLKSPRYIPFTEWRELETMRNVIILFDEIATAVDSRNFKSGDQMEFTHFFAQLRKRGNTFIYTAQRFNLVEKRIREQTDYVIECVKVYHNKHWYLYQDLYDTQQGVERAKFLGRYHVAFPHYIYSQYDTLETVETTLK